MEFFLCFLLAMFITGAKGSRGIIHAAKGTDDPATKIRLAELEAQKAAGVVIPPRFGAGDFAANAWEDAWLAAEERRRQAKAERDARRADPNLKKETFRERLRRLRAMATTPPGAGPEEGAIRQQAAEQVRRAAEDERRRLDEEARRKREMPKVEPTPTQPVTGLDDDNVRRCPQCAGVMRKEPPTDWKPEWGPIPPWSHDGRKAICPKTNRPWGAVQTPIPTANGNKPAVTVTPQPVVLPAPAHTPNGGGPAPAETTTESAAPVTDGGTTMTASAVAASAANAVPEEITNLETSNAAHAAMGKCIEEMQELLAHMETVRARAAAIAQAQHDGCEAMNVPATAMDGIDGMLAAFDPATFANLAESIESGDDSNNAVHRFLNLTFGDSAQVVADTGVKGEFLNPTR